MRENYRNSIASINKFPKFTTMNVIDGQAGLIICASLIFYSLTIDNILNIIILLILAGVTISMLIGENSIIGQSIKARDEQEYAKIKELIKLEMSNEMIENKTNNRSENQKILWDSPFQYQLIKSTEEENIKNKLGREIEPTDLFYEVNSSAAGLNNANNKHIYIINLQML